MKHDLDLFRGNFLNSPREMSSFHREMSRLFESFFHPFYGKDRNEITFTPACDVEEQDADYLITLDVPGIPKEAIQIELDDHHQLIISGERKEEKQDKTKSRFSTERFYGAFKRIFSLPVTVDREKIDAQFENGVLRISIPKSKTTQFKQIKINDAQPGNKGVTSQKEVPKNKSSSASSVQVA